jgi:2-dehydro-3-deoxygluconokinase
MYYTKQIKFKDFTIDNSHIPSLTHSPIHSICCFGEILIRFSPQLQGKFIKDASMSAYIGGAELNVANALSIWGVPAKYVTAMPDNYLSEEILTSLKENNIDISSVVLTGERIGSYYLPQGADLKHSGVIYDRAWSSFGGLKPGQLDWDKILDGASWFHFSAISPALNEDAAAVCLEAVKAASAKGLTVSVDLNYRAKLWQYGKQPVEVMPELTKYCNVIMGNVWAAQKLLGIEPEENFDPVSGDKDAYLKQAALSSKKIMKIFPSCHTIANTFRFDEGEGINYFAALDNAAGQVASNTYRTQHIVDRVGSGDCFMGGLIYGLIKEHAPKDIIEFAAAAAFGKLQQTGDATTNKVDAIKKIISDNE